MESAGKKPAGKKSVVAIIVAAGRGNRLAGDVPKQYSAVHGKTILRRTLDVFLNHPGITSILTIIHGDDRALYEATISGLKSSRLLQPVIGGQTRQASVFAGLQALGSGDDDAVVLIHDAARPFVSTALIGRAIAAAAQHGAAIPGADVTDTIVMVSADQITQSPDRATLRAIQTPQAFRLDLILAAHEKADASHNHAFTDDGSVARFAGHAVHVFKGDQGNIKITTAGDLDQARHRLGAAMISRTATGFDVHAFGSGDHIWLCGVKVPHSKGFIAHSDGDVALHALTDALVGAMAEGDIGQHFPPSDPKWKGAASDQFLAFAAQRLRERGGMIDLLDVTILCEEPKIGPYALAMRQRIADIVDISLGKVSVKATTTERLGFTGRKEGIAAQASATIRLPD
jgi:2-C-methyl-D-erythritol 4-phosphate cytidylyltransferase / 2-C-methyl-D-erythritol 2,4-cyclodiphosphate synthase